MGPWPRNPGLGEHIRWEKTAMVPGNIERFTYGMRAVTGSWQSSLHLRVELLWVRDKVLPLSRSQVASRIEVELSRTRGGDVLGAHTGKEGYDVSASRDWEPNRPNSSTCLNCSQVRYPSSLSQHPSWRVEERDSGLVRLKAMPMEHQPLVLF